MKTCIISSVTSYLLFAHAYIVMSLSGTNIPRVAVCLGEKVVGVWRPEQVIFGICAEIYWIICLSTTIYFTYKLKSVLNSIKVKRMVEGNGLVPWSSSTITNHNKPDIPGNMMLITYGFGSVMWLCTIIIATSSKPLQNPFEFGILVPNLILAFYPLTLLIFAVNNQTDEKERVAEAQPPNALQMYEDNEELDFYEFVDNTFQTDFGRTLTVGSKPIEIPMINSHESNGETKRSKISVQPRSGLPKII